MRRTIVATFPLLLCATTAFAQGGLTPRSSPLQVVEPDPAERDLRMTPVVRAVQKAADSVVSIYLQHQMARREAVTEGQGSGVILDASGLVITNWHVVAPVVLGQDRNAAIQVEIKLRDGRQRPATVLSSSAKRDLALLQMKLEAGEQVKPIEIGRSSDLMIGETVIAIGNPQGHANTVTSGVLSAIDRTIQVRTPDGAVRPYAGLLQTDAAINQGNSGGALLDITGRLIGINNAMAMGAENIGFAIPMDTVREEFSRELLQSASFAGSVDSPWLGLEVADRDGRVVVDKVVPGGPAQLAGVQVGDELARIDGQEVKTAIDYLRTFAGARTRREFPLQLRRGGRTVDLAPKPLTRVEGVLLTTLGATVQEVGYADETPLVRAATIAFYDGSGYRRVQPLPAVLRVDSVAPDGPAATTGLRAGDIVLSVLVDTRFGEQERALTSARELAALLEQNAGKTLRLAKILRGDDVLEGNLEIRRLR